MSTAFTLYETVKEAWASIPPPPVEDLKYMAWGWGEEAAHTFVGIAPADVDIKSIGFFAATPLLDLPPRAAAAYLGTFIMSLLKGIDDQKSIGVFDDVLSRAHTLTCLTVPGFWEDTIRPFLPLKCREVLVHVVSYLASEMDSLSLTKQQVETMLALASEN